MHKKYRVMEYGVQSYFSDSEIHAIIEAEKVIKRNGSGLIERFNGEVWKIIYKFESSNGLIAL